MIRTGISPTKLLILREAGRRVHFDVSSRGGAAAHNEEVETSSRNSKNCGGKIDESSCWVPHPRNGIYVPRGHEGVMDDVPESAASFSQTYWLRNVDGVEKADHDAPAERFMPTNFN